MEERNFDINELTKKIVENKDQVTKTEEKNIQRRLYGWFTENKKEIGKKQTKKKKKKGENEEKKTTFSVEKKFFEEVLIALGTHILEYCENLPTEEKEKILKGNEPLVGAWTRWILCVRQEGKEKYQLITSRVYIYQQNEDDEQLKYLEFSANVDGRPSKYDFIYEGRVKKFINHFAIEAHSKKATKEYKEYFYQIYHREKLLPKRRHIFVGIELAINEFEIVRATPIVLERTEQESAKPPEIDKAKKRIEEIILDYYDKQASHEAAGIYLYAPQALKHRKKR